MTPSCSEPLRLDSLEEKNCYACWAFYKEQHNVIEKPLPSAQSAVQVATVRGYSGRQDWTARSQAYLPNFSRPIQLCLSQYDRGELNAEEAAATTISEYGAQIAALERKVGSLAMEIDLLKKTPRLRPESSSEPSFIISGPLPAGSNGGVR